MMLVALLVVVIVATLEAIALEAKVEVEVERNYVASKTRDASTRSEPSSTSSAIHSNVARQPINDAVASILESALNPGEER